MIVKQVDTITFPVLSNFNNNFDKIKVYYLQNLKIIIQTISPIAITLIFFSNIIVELFFDSSYNKLATIISLLSICTIFQSATSLVGNMYIIANKTKVMFQVSFFLSLISLVLLLIGANTYVLEYFVISYIVSYICFNFPISNHFALKDFKISIFDILSIMVIPTTVSLGFCFSIYIYDYVFHLNFFTKVLLISINLILSYLLVHEEFRNLLGLKKNVWHSRNI